MTNQTTNMLIEFGKCTQGVAYNVVNWGSKLLRSCPDDSKYSINKVIKDGSRISFVFDGPFEIFSNGTVNFWGTSYNVVGNVIKEGSTAVLRGFNTTSACSSSNLRSDLFPDSAIVVQDVGIASGWRIADEDNPDGLAMQNSDLAITSGLASFGTQMVVMVCGVLFSICAIFKIREYCKGERKKSLDLDEIYPDEVHHYRLNDKFTGHNGKVYQYNEDKDIYELAGEAPNYV
ncbi:MAG: hypothetical protein LN566_03220 [Rickettsia endosymbiont of Stiretrus anchorago]|nr:hypothetical protein [Rickettsia endosymbiont of Stiretrus anchorago]